MKVCIPVEEDRGLESPVCAHFGSAPFFLIVDSESGECRTRPNVNRHHGHGMCMPLSSLQGEQIDAVVVGGIGMGALAKLRNAGIEVFLSRHTTVSETISSLKAGALQKVDERQACAHHRHGAQGGNRCGNS